MPTSARRWTIALLLAGLVAAGAVSARAQQPLRARVSGSVVYVEFRTDDTSPSEFDSRLGPSPALTLTWVVELRRITRNWMDPKLAEATVQTTVRPASRCGLFVVTRRVHGDLITRTVGREALHEALTGFREPLFAVRDVPPGAYRVVVKGTVEGMKGSPVSRVHASADVEP